MKMGFEVELVEGVVGPGAVDLTANLEGLMEEVEAVEVLPLAV
jgi:hypothetical protein